MNILPFKSFPNTLLRLAACRGQLNEHPNKDVICSWERDVRKIMEFREPQPLSPKDDTFENEKAVKHQYPFYRCMIFRRTATVKMEIPEDFIGKPVTSVPSPALLVSHSKVESNCRRMRERCDELGIKLRPHVKTHKTIEGALIQTGGEKSNIVVSTVAEAYFFGEAGFSDIVVGTPVTKHVLERCGNLRRKILVHFLVNSEDGVTAVRAAEDAGSPISVLLKISAGYERAGISWENFEEIERLASKLNQLSNATFRGLYVHCGDSYTTDQVAVKSVRDQSVSRVLEIRARLEKAGIKCTTVGIGSTPSCSQTPADQMKYLTEIHPGNFAFYDCQQESYGACKREDIAVRVMTRVRSHKPERNQLLVDLGFTGLTKQGLDLAMPGYGAIQDNPNLKLVAMTQELGKIETVDGSQLDFSKFPIDSPIFVFPYHSCATAGMHPHYYVHDHLEKITAIWRPNRGW